jgi:quercetin dioxygenase-like cupin family protein
VPYSLALTRDTLAAGTGSSRALPPRHRILYVLSGQVLVTADGKDSRLDGATGWYSAGACSVASPTGATVLRYELRASIPGVSQGEAPEAPHAGSTVLLEHPIDLDPSHAYLMRADRVDFDPGGVALPHRHKGGGIRCLLEGRIEVHVEGFAPRVVEPGQAWFESGREPVYAAADPVRPTSFLRVSILPREIRGQSSIMYVDPADAARGRPRTYTVYVDEPIEIT